MKPDYDVCPRCGSRNTRRQPVELTLFHRWYCRECLAKWDDSPFSDYERIRAKTEAKEDKE